MDLKIKGKVIIVTGGAKGIGAGIVRCLADEGAIPVIAGRSADEGQRLMNDIKEGGGEAHVIAAELSVVENCRRVVEETLEKYQRIDGLINNAGINDGVGLESGNPEAFCASLEKNLYHYYNMAHYCLPSLKESKGAILNISSKTAVTGQGNTSGYASAKGAQLALTREWAVELLPYGIRVNAILPAEVMTPLYEKWLNTFPDPQKKIDSITKNIPLGQRMTTKEEIASMAAYLVSEQALHITGQQIYVDGGYVHLDRALAGVDE
ncbi:SDR family oxidoreductase [Fulvivirgaceae bacterium BMA12]|uniref:SDR family oxidoreductase n=1 Tax=Agaribacillus aureus TaxID=3051825 RepID=A0ABT8LJB8_9BACT|nr:SDR family oxidoreductase [Fulvivirgaceae bacterium BMA12]